MLGAREPDIHRADTRPCGGASTVPGLSATARCLDQGREPAQAGGVLLCPGASLTQLQAGLFGQAPEAGVRNWLGE